MSNYNRRSSSKNSRVSASQMREKNGFVYMKIKGMTVTLPKGMVEYDVKPKMKAEVKPTWSERLFGFMMRFI